SPTSTMPNDSWQVLLVLCGGVPTALLGFVFSLVRARRAVRQQVTDLAVEAFLDDDQLLAAVSCSHCPGYRGGWLLWTRGGVLALTQTELVFRTSAAEFRAYEVRIPLVSIGSAILCRVWLSPYGVRVAREDGTSEYFLFRLPSST